MSIDSFTMSPLPAILFGAGKAQMLPQTLADYGRLVLLLVGERSLQTNPVWPKLQESMEDLGLEVHIEKITGEPSPKLVDAIVEDYRQHDVAVVAAIGGGAVLDGGKAIAAMLTMEGSIIEYLEGVGSREPAGTKVPFVAVPTTAGTGSELTCNSVISAVSREGFKKSLRHENFMPDAAIIDPVLTANCPDKVSAFCSMDGFSQLVEAYLSSKATPMTDDLALGAISRLGRLNGPLTRICQGKADLADRTAMSYGAAISGICLANAGLGIIHGFTSVLGGLFPIPHGAVCATLLAVCNRVTLTKLQKKQSDSVALQKYARLGRIFSNREKASDRFYQESFIEMLIELTELVQPAPLSSYGITFSDLETIAVQSGCKNNPIELDVGERKEILKELL